MAELQVNRGCAPALTAQLVRFAVRRLPRPGALAFSVGDQIELAHLRVEVVETDARGAPTRARFTFDRPLEHPGLTFRHWSSASITAWTPPPIGARLQLAAAEAF